MYNIAVVDDNETWCFVLSHLLTQHGYHVSTFTAPHTFLKEAERFDLAIVDFSMPQRSYYEQIDGPDVIHTVKRNLQAPLMLVLISAYFPEEFVDQLSTLYPEADAFFSKKIDSTELVSKIAQLLANKFQVHNPNPLGKHPVQLQEAGSFLDKKLSR